MAMRVTTHGSKTGGGPNGRAPPVRRSDGELRARPAPAARLYPPDKLLSKLSLRGRRLKSNATASPKFMNNPKKLNVIGPQLQLLRQWRRMTQSALSTKLCALGWKVSRASVAQMETTQKRITDCDLIFLAKVLNVTISDFFPASFTPQNTRSKIRSRRLMWLPTKPSSCTRLIRAVAPRTDFKDAWRRNF